MYLKLCSSVVRMPSYYLFWFMVLLGWLIVRKPQLTILTLPQLDIWYKNLHFCIQIALYISSFISHFTLKYHFSFIFSLKILWAVFSKRLFSCVSVFILNFFTEEYLKGYFCNPRFVVRLWLNLFFAGHLAQTQHLSLPVLTICNISSYVAFSTSESGRIVSPSVPSSGSRTVGSPYSCELRITACAECRIRLNFDGLQQNWLTWCQSPFVNGSSECHRGWADLKFVSFFIFTACHHFSSSTLLQPNSSSSAKL